jgi:spore coat protein U-like protein
MRYRFLKFYIIIIALNLSYGTSALAGTASTFMSVTATVADLCIVAATDTNFGLVPGYFLTPTDVSNGTINVACTTGINYNIAIGSTSDAVPSWRVMTDGLGNYIGYTLYSDSNYMTLWGDGTNYGGLVSDTGNGLLQPHTVYARIPTGQAGVPSGVYVNTPVPVTVTW